MRRHAGRLRLERTKAVRARGDVGGDLDAALRDARNMIGMLSQGCALLALGYFRSLPPGGGLGAVRGAKPEQIRIG